MGSSRTRHPGEEHVRFIGASGNPERLQGQAGVTDPGEAVVPITLTTDRFGQRRGRRSNDGPCGTKRQCLQHPSTVMDQLSPWTFIPLVQARPGAPSLLRVMQVVADRSLCTYLCSFFPARTVLKGETRLLTGLVGKSGVCKLAFSA